VASGPSWTLRRRSGQSSLEREHADAVGLGFSLRVVEEAEKVMGNLIEGSFGQLDGEVRLAAVDQGGGGFLARTTC
jgi:hypothetical protein